MLEFPCAKRPNLQFVYDILNEGYLGLSWWMRRKRIIKPRMAEITEMSKLSLMFKWNLILLVWNLTLGREPQTYLSAKWISGFLNRFSKKKKRKWALRILTLSPHYFIYGEGAANRKLQKDSQLEREFQNTIESRQKLHDLVLKGHMDKEMVVIDYGCGPGVLAKIVAGHTKKVYGCDISTGVLDCAQILNPAPNLEYVIADEAGIKNIPDGSVDVVYSFAVIQHLSRENIEIVFENCYRKLKPGGKVVFHVHMDESAFRTEEECRSDTSLKGRIKYRYDLHCFARSPEFFYEMLPAKGFKDIEIAEISKFVNGDIFDHICSQHLLIARKEIRSS